MMRKPLAFLLFVPFFIGPLAWGAEIRIQSRGEHFEELGKDGKFHVYYSIEEAQGLVTFDLIAKTKGFVGFGLTRDGTLSGADIFIGGLRKINSTGKESTFSGDFHGTESDQLVLDSRNNWALLEAKENSTHTYLKVSRLLDTCDDEDVAIHEVGTNRIFWILGKNDWDIRDWEDHGTKFTNIFPLPVPQVDRTKFKVWEIEVERNFPERGVGRWCMIREGPKSDKDLVITAYEATLSSEVADEASLHLTLQVCVPPDGVDPEALFGPWKDDDGQPCLGLNRTLPTQYCFSKILGRAHRGKPVIFPEHVGIPLPKNVYYSLDYHYKNPAQVKFKVGLRIYYTDEPRKYVAHRISIGSNSFLEAIMIPPNQSKFTMVSFYPSQCIGSKFKVFSVLLHSHGTAWKKMRLRHFRGGQELPYILYDDYFSGSYQQNRQLVEEREVLPGDDIVMECQIKSGPEPIRFEACVAHMYAYADTELKTLNAKSWVDTDKQMKLLGITRYKTTYGEHMKTYVYEPKELAGELSHVLKHHVKWTPKLLSDLQDMYLYEPLNLACTLGRSEPRVATDHVRLPLAALIHPYKHPNSCPKTHELWNNLIN